MDSSTSLFTFSDYIVFIQIYQKTLPILSQFMGLFSFICKNPFLFVLYITYLQIIISSTPHR